MPSSYHNISLILAMVHSAYCHKQYTDNSSGTILILINDSGSHANCTQASDVFLFHKTVGHTHAWGYGHPELLTSCFNRNGEELLDIFGPMNVLSNTTWSFLKDFFEEVADTFLN